MMHSVLAARSNFSIGESILSVERLIESAQKVGAKAIGLTDTMSVTGLIDFTNRAKKAAIQPIIGCRLRLVDDPKWKKPKGEKQKTPPEYYLTYYVLSEKGLKALFKLLTLANSDERFYFTPKLGFDDLYKALKDLTSDDVAIASSDVYSVLHHADAQNILQTIVDAVSASNVFLTLTPINSPLWDTLNKKAIAMCTALGVQPLVTRPVCYDVDEADAGEVMLAVTGNVRIEDPWHKSLYWRDLHPKGLLDFKQDVVEAAVRLKARGVTNAGAAFKEGLQQTERLASMVKYVWSKAEVSLPEMAPDEFAAVTAACKKGWATRFASKVFDHQPTAEELNTIYKPRLVYELGVLRKLKVSGYFLLVQDIVSFAKRSGILVGPGRGSVGGSLVAYLMGITDCDPIRFGLLFERFINPERIDLPDADLDFMSTRRHEIIEYLVEKYGEKRVAGISNFGSLGPASAIRGVGKAFGLSEREYGCSKFSPKEHGISVKLELAADQVAEIGEFRDNNEAIWDICLKLEGVMNILGRHAAGVVVSGCDLTERAVIERRKDGATVNWDKRIVEDQGLVKVDILGLETLDLVNMALGYIKQRHAKKIDLLRVPLDDPKVLENFANGVTTGVFQFESGGMRRLLKELGKDGTITFDDITAATALYRPGPMDSGMMDSYYLRKQGHETVEYDHPGMTEALKDTFGVMVYQEEVMQVARDIAGYSMADADKLRKIMGKKLPEEMEKERGKFVSGCIATSAMTEELATEIFEKIAKFAAYGFNKSHSVEYTLISYQSMWLKTYYPVEFFASALSLMKDEKLPALLKDAERFGIEVVLPDINLSTGQFEILTDTQLGIPFNRIKGISSLTTDAILEARKAGPFKSIADLEARVEKRRCNVKHREVLDRIGAFARIEPTQLAAKHPSRIKDQRDLIPGLITDVVPIEHEMHRDKATIAAVIEVVKDYRAGHSDDGLPVKPHVGTKPQFMIVFDAPNAQDEREGFMARSSSYAWQQTIAAMDTVGLSQKDVYVTALIKRPKAGKSVTPEEIRTYLPYLLREIEILKPPMIVLMGSAVVRQFIPDFKGKASDAAGTVIYCPAHNTNLIVGFSPGEIYHDPEKVVFLNEVFSTVSSLSV